MRESDGIEPTRRGFLRATGPALLAVGATPVLAPTAWAQDASDVEMLERLLALERRLESAYEAALRRDAIEPRLGETLRDQEREHADGRRAPRATVPPPELGEALADRDAFGQFALDLEGETVDAYADAVATLRHPGLRQPLGAIMANEAQHEVALRNSLGESLISM
jgi:Ferritin-like domain